MQVKSYAISDQGRVRSRNEDSFLNDDELKLYIVADGMGGHVGGDVASKMAVRRIQQSIIDPNNNAISNSNSASGSVHGVRLISALKKANEEIYNESAGNSECRGMGTTATAILVHDHQATIAHVGDSRAYLIRQDYIRQITEDHSWVNEQVKAGFITSEEARNHRLKNVITRSLGHERDVRVDILRLDLKAGDKYLLCSDGLSNMMTDQEMFEVVSSKEPSAALDGLVEMANNRGGYDNITAVMVHVVGD